MREQILKDIINMKKGRALGFFDNEFIIKSLSQNLYGELSFEEAVKKYELSNEITTFYNPKDNIKKRARIVYR